MGFMSKENFDKFTAITEDLKVLEQKHGVKLLCNEVYSKLYEELSVNDGSTVSRPACCYSSNTNAVFSNVPTDPMMNYVRVLESRHNVKFTGNTRDEAREFIKYYKDRITPEQIRYVQDICNILGLTFKGSTKYDATDFITEYKSTYKEIKRNLQALSNITFIK